MYMLNNSRYPPMLRQCQVDIKDIFDTIVTLKSEDASLRQYIEECNEKLNERINKQEEVHKKFVKIY